MCFNLRHNTKDNVEERHCPPHPYFSAVWAHEKNDTQNSGLWFGKPVGVFYILVTLAVITDQTFLFGQ